MNTERLLPRVLRKLTPWKWVVSEPAVLRLALQGHNVSLYLSLRQPWLRQLGLRTVVDVGANVGQFGVLARAAFPGIALHCFEPLPDCFVQLERRLGGKPGVTLHNVALGERIETSAMTRSPYSPSSSLLEMTPSHREAFPFTAGGERVPVRVATLDEALDGYSLAEPMLVKIDVQGAEDRVIAGGRAVLGRAAVAVVETSFEPLYRGQPLFEEIQHAMQALGFSYRGNLGQLASPADGRILQCDAIFVRQ